MLQFGHSASCTKKIRSHGTRNELARDELARDELARDELARDELARDELARDELARDELARGDPSRPRQQGEEKYRNVPCILNLSGIIYIYIVMQY